jgi:hypothetical protein
MVDEQKTDLLREIYRANFMLYLKMRFCTIQRKGEEVSNQEAASKENACVI